MAHPDRIATALLPDALEQRRRRDDLDIGAAELRGVTALDLAAELLGHGLLAIADAQDRQAVREDLLRGARRVRRRAPRPGRRRRSTPFGFIRWNASEADWNGAISQ